MLVNAAAPSLQEIGALKKRFQLLNRERLVRAQSALRERQRDFLEVLPLLFHTNHPSLPGFVSKNTPAGVSEYRPSDHAMEAAKRFAKTFTQKRRALLRYEILGLYLMGSSGTIAYSKKSDFDIWICYRDDIDVQGLDELRQKAQAIEQWAATLDLEVHFFLVEPNSFSRGVHEDMSAESSGSAQHYLLMEEFYRTGLLLAGRYPLWWLVPPEAEAHYEEYTEMLRQKRFINENECIDFGAIPGVPAAEFFGAALWQLYKGIDSPYKSALKLLLMEAYAYEYPATNLLCFRFKKAIYDGETSLDKLDPYVMLSQKIEDYLLKRGEKERLELLRRCFYFKIDEPLSVPDKSRDEGWRRTLLRSITDSWGWDKYYLQMLDMRAHWKIDRVVRERSVLVKAFTFSYQFLSDFARRHAQLALINQRDLNILGRKLYSAFERKAGKVEIVNRGISNDVLESHLTFVRTVGQDMSESWLLYAAPLNLSEIRKERPLRRSLSLIELLAWCHFNGMLDGNTVLAMHSQDNSVTPRELKEMVFSFQRMFPAEKVLKTEMDDFAAPARALQAAVFVNLGVDPMAEYARQGHYVMSERSDALSYGGVGENLAISFDMITVTSWKEVLTSRYVGVGGLMDCIRDYVRLTPVGKAEPPPISAHCYSFGRGATIRQRIEELFADIIKCFYGREHAGEPRYVLAIENVFYILALENGALVSQRAGNYSELLKLLGAAQSSFHSTVVDQYALTGSVLPVVLAANREGCIQLICQTVGKDVDVYVLDEMGSLFYQRMQLTDRNAVLSHFTRFFEAVKYRETFGAAAEGGAIAAQPEVEYFEIVSHPQERGRHHLVRRDQLQHRNPMQGMNIQVLGAAADSGQSVSIYCDEHEFSSVEYGADLYKRVAQHVLAQRRSGERYSIYITDLGLPPALLGEPSTRGRVQSVTLLNYKRNIERQLNAALEELASQGGGIAEQAS